MAQSKKPERRDQDELVTRLVPNPSEVPDVQVLSGFLGDSHREGYLRLYLTPELADYVEVAEADVLHRHRLDESQSPLGGTVLWVKREAKMVHTRATTSTAGAAQAEFLRGEITSAFLQGVAGGGLGVGLFSDLFARKKTTLFHEATCALACPSKIAVCTEPGQTTCNPALCF